jgi:hypothetical protein
MRSCPGASAGLVLSVAVADSANGCRADERFLLLPRYERADSNTLLLLLLR